jgi:hypothetical protein
LPPRPENGGAIRLQNEPVVFDRFYEIEESMRECDSAQWSSETCETVAPELMNTVGLPVRLSAYKNSRTVEQVVGCDVLTASVMMAVLCVLVPKHWYARLCGTTSHKMKIFGCHNKNQSHLGDSRYKMTKRHVPDTVAF